MRSGFRLWQQGQRRIRHPHGFRPAVEALEDRLVLSAPSLDPIAGVTVPQGKSLVVPVTASQANPGSASPLTYTVTSSDSQFTAEVHRGNYLRMTVEGFGDLVFQIFDDLTPTTAAMIEGLAKAGFYDGLFLPRVLSGFVVQGGSPDGNTISGGPPKNQGQSDLATLRQQYQFNDEFNTSLLFTGTAQLAMANSGDDTNGSQFFITLGSPRNLDINHTILGQLVRGQDILQRIAAVPVMNNPSLNENSSPVTPIHITRATVEQNLNDAVVIVHAVPGATGTANITVTAANGAETSSRNFSATAVPDTTTTIVNGTPTTTTINEPPILNPIGDQVTVSGQPVTFTVSGQDVEGDALTFTATQTDSPTHAMVEVTPVTPPPGSNPTSATVKVTPNPGFTGPIHLTISVSDGQTHVGTPPPSPDSQSIVVAVGGQAIVPTPMNVTVTDGAVLTNVPVALFTHGTTDIDPSKFTAFISWGDGNETHGTVTATSTPGTFQVTGSNTYAHAGSYTVRTRIMDNTAGNTAVVDAVADAPLTGTNGGPLTTVAGIPLTSVLIGSFSDANPLRSMNDYQVTINWGDNTTSPGTVTPRSGGGFNVSGTHTYGKAGSFTATAQVVGLVQAGEVQGATTSVSAAVTVTAAPANQVYVRQLYRDLLKREGDEPSVALLTDRLDTGQFNPFQVTFFMTNSPEYQRVRVNDLYVKLLGRPVDDVGAAAATGFLARGGRIEQVEVAILGSKEYNDNHLRGMNDQPNDAFINAVFQNLLGRPPDTATLNKLRLALTFPNVTHAAAASTVVFSDDFRKARTKELFQDLLGRAASDNDQSAFASLFRSGVRDEFVTAAIAASPEYFNKTTQQQ